MSIKPILARMGLVDAVGISKEILCMGCLNGLYPVEIPGEKCLATHTELSEYIVKATEDLT